MHNIKGTTLIHIGGKERPIYFGFMQTRIFCELREKEYYEYIDEVNKAFGHTGKMPEGLSDEEQLAFTVKRMDLFVLADLIYSALVAGTKHPDHRATAQQDFTPEDVAFWLDVMQPEEMTKVYKTLLAANDRPNEKSQEQAPRPAASPSA